MPIVDEELEAVLLAHLRETLETKGYRLKEDYAGRVMVEQDATSQVSFGFGPTGDGWVVLLVVVQVCVEDIQPWFRYHRLELAHPGMVDLLEQLVLEAAGPPYCPEQDSNLRPAG